MLPRIDRAISKVLFTSATLPLLSLRSTLDVFIIQNHDPFVRRPTCLLWLIKEPQDRNTLIKSLQLSHTSLRADLDRLFTIYQVQDVRQPILHFISRYHLKGPTYVPKLHCPYPISKHKNATIMPKTGKENVMVNKRQARVIAS